MTTVIDTTGLGSAEREELWRHAMTDTFVSCSIGDFTEGGAHGTIGADWLGDLMIGEVNASGQDIHRNPSHVNSAPAEYFQVAVMGHGVARMTQDDRQAVLHPGDALIYETNRPFEWAFDADWHTWVFSFPTDAIPLSPDQRSLLTARRLDGGAAMTGVVTRFLMDLATRAPELATAATNPRRLAQHAADLVVTLVGQGIEPTEPIRGSVQRTLLLRAQDYVEQRLRDPGLTPSEVAASVGISTRYLQKLFATEGQSVAAYMRDRRLDTVHRALLDPAHANRTIATLAMNAGFGDLSGFNRAFRDRYGMTPRDLRHFA